MKRLLVVLALIGVVVFGFAGPAHAHDVLVGSDPPAGATLASGPTTVRLDFDAPVQRGPNLVTVVGPNGRHFERSDSTTVTGDSVSAEVGPLGPIGVYTVGYRIISADGHPVTGAVTFTLTTAGTGTGTNNPAGDGQSGAVGASGAAGSDGGVPIWIWLVGAAVLLGLGLVIALRATGRKDDQR